MRIGIRKSPHLEAIAQGIAAAGDTFTSTNDTGADWYLCWGWPQAEQVARDNGGCHERIICVDAHPFALMAGDRSGARILQLGNWGALAAYPPGPPTTVVRRADQLDPWGEVLVLGQVYTAEQERLGLVDVWHTGGYGAWVRDELVKPERRFRMHPRIWARENDGKTQPSLAEDLMGCRTVASWNSTAAIHAQLLGYPALPPAEPHGWAHMSLEQLAGLTVSPEEMRSGSYWHVYRDWLRSKDHVGD